MLKIGIFCASSNHIAPIYYEQTAGLGKWIGTHHHTIVYGGITQGLMECVAKNVKESGGKTIGVILQDMFECELASPNLDQLIITNDLAERKNKIMEINKEPKNAVDAKRKLTSKKLCAMRTQKGSR